MLHWLLCVQRVHAEAERNYYDSQIIILDTLKQVLNSVRHPHTYSLFSAPFLWSLFSVQSCQSLLNSVRHPHTYCLFSAPFLWSLFSVQSCRPVLNSVRHPHTYSLFSAPFLWSLFSVQSCQPVLTGCSSWPPSRLCRAVTLMMKSLRPKYK